MKRIFFSLIISLCSLSSYATHIIGGEISYKSLGGNLYEFTVKIYRDCLSGGAALDNPAYFTVFNSSNVVISNPAVSLLTDSIIPVISPDICLTIPPNICVEEGTYIFQVSLPPSPGGYKVVYQRCCRNPSIINLSSPSTQGATYTADLNDSCLAFNNNSAYFLNYPPIVICASQPLSFDHSAIDPDGDSLVYELCQPFLGASSAAPAPTQASNPPYTGVSYVSPYTYLNPMDGSPPLVINSATGLLTITPTSTGQFVVGICVKEYRNGVYLGFHLRDFQFNVVNCQVSVVASIPTLINNCTGYYFQFDNNSFGGITYHWDFGDTTITTDTSNLQFPSYTYSDTGVYTVTLIVNPGSTCGDTATATVYVYPNLFAGMIAPDGCQFIPIHFTDTSSTTFGIINSWNWNFGNGSFSNQQNPNYTYLDSGTYTVHLIVVTNYGCTDTITETILVRPTPEVSIDPGDTAICIMDVLQLNGVVIGGISYQWTPNYNISTTSGQSPVVDPDLNTTYYLTATNNNGCIGVDSIVILVFDTVVANAGIDTIICPGSSVQLNGSGGAQYLWSPSSGLSNSTIANPLASPTNTTQYTLVASAGSCIDNDNILITVLPLPNITAGGDVEICKGDTAGISAFGCTSYFWSPSNSVFQPDQQLTVAFPSSTTTYTVTGYDSTTCPIPVIDSLVVTVKLPTQTGLSDDTTIIYGTSGNLIATGGIDYSWSPADGLSATNISNPIVTATVTTTYYVTFTTPNGCKAYDTVIVFVVFEPVINMTNAFSPNNDGANDYFHPLIMGAVANVEFRIYNRWGQLVFESSDGYGAGWDGTYKGMPQELGVYVYEFKCTGLKTGTPFNFKGNTTLLR